MSANQGSPSPPVPPSPSPLLVGSTQSEEPSGWNSFFQIGTHALTRSIAARQASKASRRCGAAATTATETSPTSSRPARCWMRTRASGQSSSICRATLAISDSAIGPYASYWIATVGSPSFSLRTTPRNRQTPPSEGRTSLNSAATSMGLKVRCNASSSAGQGRQERDFVTVTKDALGGNVFAVDGGGGHGGEGGQPRDLPGHRLPELPDSCAFGQLPDLLGKAGGVPKGREVKEIHPHRRQVYACESGILTLTDWSDTFKDMARAAANHEAERRLLLLKAAFPEVAEKGFSHVTLEDIALRAGVSKGGTLYYFSSKEDLFRELFSWLIDTIQQRMREAVDAVADPVEKVRALVALIFPSPSKNRAFFRAYIDFCGLASRRETFPIIDHALSPGCRAGGQGILEKGIRQGVFLARDPAE